MLGLFGNSKVSHPLADEQERQRVMERLAAADSLSALTQGAEWLRGLRDEAGLPFGLRALLIRQFDDVARPHVRAVAREYLTMAHLGPEEETALWHAARNFSAQAAAAYSACLSDLEGELASAEGGRGDQARFLVRLMQAYAARQKWDQFRYWPTSETLWQIVGRALLIAERAGLSRREVSAHHGDARQTTVEQEYLRMLVFHVSGMDGLLPFEIEIAEQLIAHLLPHFALAAGVREGLSYFVHPGERRAPARIVGETAAGADTRYLESAAAATALEELRRQLQRGEVPHELGALRYRSARIIMPVVRRLAVCWEPDPPQRAHARHRVRSRLAVVSGLSAAHAALAGVAQAEVEHWTAENVSLGGIRAVAPLPRGESARIGTLLGIQAEGGENWLVGVVRRLVRESEANAALGIETLSRAPLALQVEGAQRHEALLLDAPDEGEEVQVVLPGLGFDPGAPLRATLLGERIVLEPVRLAERGVDFDLACYRVAGLA